MTYKEKQELRKALKRRIHDLDKTCPLCKKYGDIDCSRCPAEDRFKRTTYCMAFVKGRERLLQLLESMMETLR